MAANAAGEQHTEVERAGPRSAGHCAASNRRGVRDLASVEVMDDRLDRQPVVGWRLWKLHADRLRSWVIPQDWAPGPNEAQCMTNARTVTLFNPGAGGCARPPGVDCRCGLWALWDFAVCARKAREESAGCERPNVVIGLVAGWGTVAIHGEEGFRSEYAAVRCLFSDAVAFPLQAVAERRTEWWERLVRRTRAVDPAVERMAALRRAAAHYGVPLLSLADAVRLGVLGELGVPAHQVHEMAAALTAGGPTT